MKEIKKVSVKSAVHLGSVCGGLVGLLAGVMYSFGGLIIDAVTTGLNEGTALAFGALLGMPLIGLGYGLVVGLVGSLLYNFVAKQVGGIKIDIK